MLHAENIVPLSPAVSWSRPAALAD